MHACEWDASIPLTNKRIAIVGSGPTALQIVPEIAHLTAQLDIYQRTPNWIQPFNNHPFTEAQKETWRKDPKALRDKRQQTINAAEGIWAAIEVPGSAAAKRVENMCTECWYYLSGRGGTCN
jgi:cation diffusion facilitator CzcD-associated flavoprotein CzcO